MKIAIISGSHRNHSQSEKVARFVQKTLKINAITTETWLYSLSGNPLPLWDQGIWDGDPEWNDRLNPLKKELASSDALVIITPEWHGQVPSGLKNFFLLFSRFELGHKPALIISISSADGGSYPVAELRMSSYKNNRICYLPENLIIREVESVFNQNTEDNNADAHAYFQTRLQWTLELLQAYATALKPVRESGLIHHKMFGNGM